MAEVGPTLELSSGAKTHDDQHATNHWQTGDPAVCWSDLLCLLPSLGHAEG